MTSDSPQPSVAPGPPPRPRTGGRPRRAVAVPLAILVGVAALLVGLPILVYDTLSLGHLVVALGLGSSVPGLEGVAP